MRWLTIIDCNSLYVFYFIFVVDGSKDIVKTANLMCEEIMAELELKYSVESSLSDKSSQCSTLD